MRAALFVPILIMGALAATVASSQTYDLTERYSLQQVLNVQREMTLSVKAVTDDLELQKALEGGLAFRETLQARYRVLKLQGGLPSELRAYVIRGAEDSWDPEAGDKQEVSAVVGKTVTVLLTEAGERYLDGAGQELSPEVLAPWQNLLPVQVLTGVDVHAAKVGDQWVPPKSDTLDVADLHYRFAEVVTREGRVLARLEIKLGSEQPVDDSANPLVLTELSGECLFDVMLGLPYSLEAKGVVSGVLPPAAEGGKPITLTGPVTIKLLIESVDAD